MPRSHLAASSSRRVGADAREVRWAQRDARLITRESASAARGESIHSDQWQIHRGGVHPRDNMMFVFCSDVKNFRIFDKSYVWKSE